MELDYYTRESEFGYAELKKGIPKEETNGVVWLNKLFVEEEHRGSGEGTRLLQYILDDAFEFGYKKVAVHAMTLEFMEHQPLIEEFYIKNGFSVDKDYVIHQGKIMSIQL